jgi:hypothetical protein
LLKQRLAWVPPPAIRPVLLLTDSLRIPAR